MSPAELAMVRYNLGLAKHPCDGCRYLDDELCRNANAAMPDGPGNRFAGWNRGIAARSHDPPSYARACGRTGRYYEAEDE